MTIDVKKIALKEQLIATEAPSSEASSLFNLSPALDSITLQATVRLGDFTLSIAELKQLTVGQLFTLTQKTNEPVDILLNQQVVARGELLCVEEHFAIQITELYLQS